MSKRAKKKNQPALSRPEMIQAIESGASDAAALAQTFRTGVAPVERPRMRLVPRKPSEDQLRAKAHDLWLQRGSPLGTPEVDWIEAERILG